MSKWDWPKYYLINTICEDLSPAYMGDVKRTCWSVTTHQHIDWLELFILIQIKASFLSDSDLSLFMIQFDKVA